MSEQFNNEYGFRIKKHSENALYLAQQFEKEGLGLIHTKIIK